MIDITDRDLAVEVLDRQCRIREIGIERSVDVLAPPLNCLRVVTVIALRQQLVLVEKSCEVYY